VKALLPIIIGAFFAYSAHGQQMQVVDIELGKPLKLLELGGPNVELIVNSVDQFDVTVTTLDYDNTQLKITGNVYSVYGKEEPTVTRKQIKKADGGVTPIFSRGNISAYYVASIDTSQNHAKIGIRLAH
jgi:hypothetical protein